jgi:hypothetical protein
MLAKALFRHTMTATRVSRMPLVARQLVAVGARGFAANTAQIEKTI